MTDERGTTCWPFIRPDGVTDLAKRHRLPRSNFRLILSVASELSAMITLGHIDSRFDVDIKGKPRRFEAELYSW